MKKMLLVLSVCTSLLLSGCSEVKEERHIMNEKVYLTTEEGDYCFDMFECYKPSLSNVVYKLSDSEFEELEVTRAGVLVGYNKDGIPILATDRFTIVVK